MKGLCAGLKGGPTKSPLDHLPTHPQRPKPCLSEAVEDKEPKGPSRCQELATLVPPPPTCGAGGQQPPPYTAGCAWTAEDGPCSYDAVPMAFWSLYGQPHTAWYSVHRDGTSPSEMTSITPSFSQIFRSVFETTRSGSSAIATAFIASYPAWTRSHSCAEDSLSRPYPRGYVWPGGRTIS